MMTSMLKAAVFMVLVAQVAAAQDTLSDAAWKADRERRAAVRAATAAKFDSAAAAVDSVIVRPESLSMRAGDSALTYDFLKRIVAVGHRRGGGPEVVTFAKTLSIKPNPYLVRHGDYTVAVAPGVAEVWFLPGRHLGNPFEASAPHTVMPVSIH
ncbi:MAG: hypothetical protein ABJA80_06760 [bacterium]